jgi:hypothetical protein
MNITPLRYITWSGSTADFSGKAASQLVGCKFVGSAMGKKFPQAFSMETLEILVPDCSKRYLF